MNNLSVVSNFFQNEENVTNEEEIVDRAVACLTCRVPFTQLCSYCQIGVNIQV